MPLRVPEEYVGNISLSRDQVCVCGSATCNSEECLNPEMAKLSQDAIVAASEDTASLKATASFYEEMMMRYDTERESTLNQAYLENRQKERELEKKRDFSNIYDSELDYKHEFTEEQSLNESKAGTSTDTYTLSMVSESQEENDTEAESEVSKIEGPKPIVTGSDAAITWNYECLCNFVQNKNQLLDRYLEYYQEHMKYTKHTKKLIASSDFGQSRDVATMFNSTRCGLALPRPRVPAINRRIDQSPIDFLNEQSKLIKPKPTAPPREDKFIIINASELNQLLENQTQQTIKQRVITQCPKYNPGVLIPHTVCPSMSSIPEECATCMTQYERRPTFSKSLNDKSKIAKEVVKQLNVA